MQSLYKNKQFLGWSKSSTATTASYSSGGNLGTVSANTILYAVWQERDSITISATPSGIITTSNVSFTNTPDASDGLTYYFNVGTNISRQCTISIDTSTARDQYRYYIDSVTGVTGTITATGQRSWIGNNVTNNTTTATSKTITVNLKRNLYFFLHAYAIEKDSDGIIGPNPNYWSTDITMNLINNDSPVLYNSTGSNNTMTNCNHKYKSVFLNPGDSVTIQTICTNQDYYLARMHVPNNTNIAVTAWNGSYSENTKTITNTDAVDRSILKSSEGYSGNRVSASFLSTDTQYKNCTYTLTIPTGNDGIALMGSASTHKTQRTYLVYEPFHCQIQLTNTNYTPSISRTNTLTNSECLYTSGTPKIYRFFNDINLSNSQYIYCKRNNNNTNSVITGISIDNVVDSYIYPVLWNGINKINNLYYFQNVSGQTIGSYTYNLEHFLNVSIQPDASLLSTYHAPWNINVTWSNTDYKCIIILRLPEANEDSNTTETDTNEVGNKIYFNGSGWEYQNATDKNKKVYVKEITNLTSASTLNTTLQDVANSGYILKSIKKYRYNGDWNSSLTTTTVTRDQLDAGTATLPAGWTRSSSDTSNDILTLNQNNLTTGSVDYYFITYEEGLPIFYPDSENNPKRAIQLYWEGNRAIGLYYENTKLL